MHIKKLICSFLCFALFSTSTLSAEQLMALDTVEHSEQDYDKEISENAGKAARDSSYIGTSMSMVGWGIVLIASITLLAIFLKGTSESSSDSS